MKKYILILAVLTVALTTLSRAAYAQGAIVDFGNPVTGAFELIPNDVTINVGETVTYNVHGNHQIAIYKVDDTTTRADIEPQIMPGLDYVITDAAAVPIVDTANRNLNHPATIHDHTTSPAIFMGASRDDVDSLAIDRDTALSHNVTFLQPGRYLVFCTVKGHLDNGPMFGFVTVLP